MADTHLHLIKQFAEFQPVKGVTQVPRKRRGIYVLYKRRKRGGKQYFDVVYVGMTTTGIRGRLNDHLKRKQGLWTHFSAFEVWDNVRAADIRELEGLFRHLYRKDTRAGKLNVQRRYAKAEQTKQNDFAQWK